MKYLILSLLFTGCVTMHKPIKVKHTYNHVVDTTSSFKGKMKVKTVKDSIDSISTKENTEAEQTVKFK